MKNNLAINDDVRGYEEFCDAWLEAWTGNQPEKLRSFYSKDAFYRDPARPDGLNGAELLPYFRKLLQRNPDWQWKRVEILPTEKGFCLKWEAAIPLQGRLCREAGLDIIEIENGKITRNDVYFDRSAFFRL